MIRSHKLLRLLLLLIVVIAVASAAGGFSWGDGLDEAPTDEPAIAAF